jgi:hypothetical protein
MSVINLDMVEDVNLKETRENHQAEGKHSEKDIDIIYDFI